MFELNRNRLSHYAWHSDTGRPLKCRVCIRVFKEIHQCEVQCLPNHLELEAVEVHLWCVFHSGFISYETETEATWA